MTRIDEFSRVLGSIETSQKSLENKLDEHCDDDERRHQENITAIRDLTESVRPVVETVKRITPLVDAQQKTWLQIGGAVTTVSGLLAFVAYVMSLAGSAILKKLGWS
jgi:hypothetical protein